MRHDIFSLKSEKNKAISVVSLVVFTLAAALFYEGIQLHSKTIDQVMLEEKKSVASTIKIITHYSFTPYKLRLANLIAAHENISKAFLDQDRETLYRLTLPLFKALKRENKYLHVMHFHRPDGRTFLRMHNPKKFDDDLRKIRPAVQQVQQEKTSLACYEIGIHGAFYRIIQPVFHQGSYAGVVELGIKPHTILDSLQKQISAPVTTFYMADKWQHVTTPLEYEFLNFGEYTLNTHNDDRFKQLPPDIDLFHDNQPITIDNNSYILHAYSTFDNFKGEPIGGFALMQDISQTLIAKKTFIFQSLIFSCLLLAISLSVLYLSFGKLIGKLERSRSSLKKTVVKLAMKVKERKQTEVQLRESKKEWERTFDAIGDIVTIINSDFQIIKANRSTYKMLNLEPDTLNGKFCHEVFSKKSLPCDGCPVIETIDNSQVSSAEIEHKNLEKHFLITTSLAPDRNNEFTNIVHIAKDITREKKLETQLRQSQKMEAIGTLAGGIAHDFNNILTAIYGYTQLAMLKAGDDSTIVKNLKQVNSATERARDLVKQILTFSRQTEHAKSPLQISPIAKEALKLLRSSIPTTIEFKQHISSQGNILGDSTQIHQIIMNLVTNAYHAIMETGGILEVSLQDVTVAEKDMIAGLEIRPGKYICLEVSDTGPGVEEETKRKIFEPYFTTKKVGKGTGLGLAVVHGIVTDHHGYINVCSEPGQVTTFSVYLPIVEEEPIGYPPQAAEEPIYGDSERIMVIDDEEIIVNLAAEALTLHGYKITSFTNSILAIQDFEEHPEKYDLVITDMSMPYMTGLQLIQKIKRIRPDLPIILCSGYSKLIDKEKALAMGISRYITKPLIMDKLARLIRELLDRER